jgi:hypothetical protein
MLAATFKEHELMERKGKRGNKEKPQPDTR